MAHKRLFQRIVCLYVALQFSVAPVLGDVNAVTRNGAPASQGLTANSEELQNVFVLDEWHREALFKGLTVSLPQTYTGVLPVIVETHCISLKGTPPLAIDEASFQEGARLLNLTASKKQDCRSYRVAAHDLQQPQSSKPPGIAIDLADVSPPPQPSLVSGPSIFVFNPVHGNWTEAKPYSPAGKQTDHAYATLSEQNAQIIGGVIAVPQAASAEPSRNSPSSLAQSLEGVSPTNGYLSIDRIEPDNKGAYGIALPLLLRPSRGPGPSFSIRYNPQGAPGMLGRGWDLSISSVEVRGSSPLYDPNYETEDYTLDGMDLIALDADGKDIPSLYKGGPIIARVITSRAFRLRNNTSGLLVRRFGDGPSSYYWEVWDPHAHNTRLYGKTPDGDLPPELALDNGLLRAPENPNAVGQWALTEEYNNQPAKNGAFYTYVQKKCADTWSTLNCKQALHLDSVDYNRAFNLASNAPLSGATHVHFKWSERAKERFVSDAHLGFLRVNETWLSDISVGYQPEQHQAWLQKTDYKAAEPNEVLFANHHFELTNDNPCMNYDTILTSYKVTANVGYDKGPLQDQTFTFHYQGEKSKAGGADNDECLRPWSGEKQKDHLGDDVNAEAPGGQIGFPSSLIKDLGFGITTQQSLLGTGRTQELGASIYVGVGLASDTTNKGLTVGVNAGVDFTKSIGNSTLVDITGNGIDDIVYRQGNSLRYCAGERQSKDENGVYRTRFPPERCGTIEGIDDFSVSTGTLTSVGVEVFPGFSTFAGVGYSTSMSDQYAYFIDRDGDGLVDAIYYGQVFYNLGEDRANKIVRFSRKRSLTPPIPGQISGEEILKHSDPYVRTTIRNIEKKLETLSKQLQRLEYSQTTLAWEAPFDGAVSIAGHFQSGASKVDPDDALGAAFDTKHFENLHDSVVSNQREYIDPRERCELWSDEARCPDHRVLEAHIDFPHVSRPAFQVSISRRGQAVVECTARVPIGIDADISAAEVLPVCRDDEAASNFLKVRTGDVLYITYTVHPFFQSWTKPSITVGYERLPGDAAFAIMKSGDPAHRLNLLRCTYKDEGGVGRLDGCPLFRQTRFQFASEAALTPTSPGAIVEIPPGSERRFGGRFEIPRDLIKDYQIYFDVAAAVRPSPPQSPRPDPRQPVQLNPQNAVLADPVLLFRQPVTDSCAPVSDVCVVDVNPKPPCVRSTVSDCDKFWDANASNYAVSARLTLEYRGTGSSAIQATNVGSRLSSFRWRIPPHISSFPTEAETKDLSARKRAIFYVPVSLGDEDLEYRRIEEGNFASPDTNLRDTPQPDPLNIDFKSIVSDERENVELTKTRQVIGLCGFAEEIFYFLQTHYSSDGAPFTPNFLPYYRKKIDAYSGQCVQAKATLAEVRFTEGDRPESGAGDRNGLRLPELLRALPYAEQMTSAQTLLERVLTNFALGQSLMTDDARLTRRGYRLPAKINPLECSQITRLSQDTIPPLQVPIVGPDLEACHYRLSSNFAMQELEDLTDPITGQHLLSDEKIKRIRNMLSRFKDSTDAAFDIGLTATINGAPVLFHELTGEKVGNDACKPSSQAALKTCMGSYGNYEPIQPYFYPKINGDVFPRITTNKRNGRVVAFSNTIMDIIDSSSKHDDTLCPRSYPPYKSLAEVEAKQDCLFKYSEIDAREKYSGDPSYKISYTIGENNHFSGRNRVLEFSARPLDVLELHFRISGTRQNIRRPSGELTGRFSVLESRKTTSDTDALPMGLKEGRYIIPRSPSQILPGGDVMLDCPAAPQVPEEQKDQDRPEVWRTPGSIRLPSTCRPWTKLGWTEVFLGAEYRTYSDAQKILPGKASNIFSLKRRRELLRLQPELEVQAEGYVLENLQADLPLIAPGITDLADTQSEVFLRHTAAVIKVSGDWALFAMRATAEGTVRVPPPFIPTSFVVRGPTLPAYPPSARYDTPGSVFGDVPDAKSHFESATSACGKPGDKDDPDYAGCQTNLSSAELRALGLTTINIFPLIHRFVGPTVFDVAEKSWRDLDKGRRESGVCASELPRAVANCWRGVDDTVFFESAVRDVFEQPDTYSVSALIGFEKPPLADFDFKFTAYNKIICMDRENLRGSCLAPIPADTADTKRFPNRPNPPNDGRAIEVFAPIQSTSSVSISENTGAALFNEDGSQTRRTTNRRYLDINGDGFPDEINDGIAELSSPVGLSRRDWWTYFRVDPSSAPTNIQMTAGGYQEGGTSLSRGQGIGLSPSTFAQVAKTKYTGSPDANVDPSFSFTMEKGYDTSFKELIDVNGDGLPDFVDASGKVDVGLDVRFNAGNGLLSGTDDKFEVPGAHAAGKHYNTTHSSGFAVRLGFSYGAGSFGAGAGITHRDGSSEATLIDMTGSGRPDLVVPADENGNLWVFPNLGNGFGRARKHHLNDWFAQPVRYLGTEAGTSLSETTLVDAGALVTFGTNVWILKVVFNPGIKLARGQTRELLNIRDINGDGAPDLIAVSGRFLPGKAPDNLTTQVYYNPEAKTHLLTEITNPSGSTWTMSHDLLGNSGPENGRPVWALTGVALSDGYDPKDSNAKGSFPSHGQDVRLTSYTYNDGYFNRAEKQFYGFAKRTAKVWGCDLATKDYKGDCLEALNDGSLAADKLSV